MLLPLKYPLEFYLFNGGFSFISILGVGVDYFYSSLKRGSMNKITLLAAYVIRYIGRHAKYPYTKSIRKNRRYMLGWCKALIICIIICTYIIWAFWAKSKIYHYKIMYCPLFHFKSPTLQFQVLVLHIVNFKWFENSKVQAINN